MTPERWQRIKDILLHALEHDGDARAAAITAACGGDLSLRRDVEELLMCRDAMGSFLERSTAGDEPGESDTDIPIALTTWDRYHVLGRLGAGGMATVYQAWDPRLRRTTAIKLISSHDEAIVGRFLREAEAQARVEHDHILKIFETGSVGDHHFIAMQYVDGPTLLGVRAETTLDQKVELIATIADGLQAAHRIGLVHRDIKPANILVERRPEGLKPYLLDFGLAAEVDAPALTQTGVIVGTPRYMAPERIRGGAAALDRRSDVYSLGATFYEFVCGMAPFEDSSGFQLLIDVVDREVRSPRAVLPTLPADLDAIISKCIEKDPNDRYQSARALAADLRRYLNGDAVSARRSGRVHRWANKARRHPRLTTAFALLGVVIVGVAGWGGYQSWRSARQADVARQLGQEVEGIDWMFRAAQMSPLHAIDAERRQVRERMTRIEAMTRSAGSIAFGPSEYALGRGYLTLGDETRAIDHLERAWRSGYRTADAAMALGLAYGEQYRSELSKAQRVEIDRVRNERIADLQSTVRAKSLAYLQDGRESRIVTPAYVEALIATHLDDLDTAIVRAEAATHETPWLFEAHVLAGQAASNDAFRLFVRHALDLATKRTDEAIAQFAAAERIAPSSLDAHVGRCAATGLLFHLIGHGIERDLAPVLAEAKDACGRAVAVDSASTEAHRYYAEALSEWSTAVVVRSADPGDGFDRAADEASTALQLEPHDIQARATLADVFMNRAWWESRTNRDPSSSIERAIAEHSAVLAVDPRNLGAADNLAQALILRYRNDIRRGVDASASFERAIAAFEHTLRLEPSYAGGFISIEKVAVERADDQRRHGADPAPGLRSIIAFIDALPSDHPPQERVDALQTLRARLR